MTKKRFALALSTVCLVALVAPRAFAANAGVELGTNHRWNRGEYYYGDMTRLINEVKRQYETETGRDYDASDEHKAIAHWYWRACHYFHSTATFPFFEDDTKVLTDMSGTTEYRGFWNGLFGLGFSLCGSTHAQWTVLMDEVFGHHKSRVAGTSDHNTFEVYLTGGAYGAGRWAHVDQDELAIIFSGDPAGSANARRCRRAGQTPAVVYSHGKDALALAVSTREIVTLIRKGLRVVTLEIEGVGKKSALIQGVEYDSLGDVMEHIDFLEFTADDRLHVHVTLKLHGTPIGVSKDGGVLYPGAHVIEVECAPDRVVSELRIEVGEIKLNQRLHASELPLPEGFKLRSPGDVVIAAVTMPRGEEDLSAAAGAADADAAAGPEVIAKGKVATEGEEGGKEKK